MSKSWGQLSFDSRFAVVALVITSVVTLGAVVVAEAMQDRREAEIHEEAALAMQLEKRRSLQRAFVTRAGSTIQLLDDYYEVKSFTLDAFLSDYQSDDSAIEADEIQATQWQVKEERRNRIEDELPSSQRSLEMTLVEIHREFAEPVDSLASSFLESLREFQSNVTSTKYHNWVISQLRETQEQLKTDPIKGLNYVDMTRDSFNVLRERIQKDAIVHDKELDSLLDQMWDVYIAMIQQEKVIN